MAKYYKKRSSRYYKKKKSWRKAAPPTVGRYGAGKTVIPKGNNRRLVKFAQKIDRALDASGDVQKYIYHAVGTCNQAAVNQCATVGYFHLTGFDCTGANGGDLAGLSGIAFNSTSKSTIKNESDKLYLRSSSLNLLFRENQSSNGFITIYEIVCRKSHKIGDYSSGASTAATWDGILAVGLARESHNTTVTGGSALAGTHLMFSPFNLQDFGQYWKVQKVHRLYVETSQSVSLDRSYRHNKFLSAEMLQKYDYFKGLSRLFVIKVHGDLNSADTDVSVAGVTIRMDNQINFSMQDLKTKGVTVGPVTAPS